MLMKRVIKFSLFILVLFTGINNQCYALQSNIRLTNIVGNPHSNCIVVTINPSESIIRINIDGTHQGDGLLAIANMNKEIVFSETIKCWNERTILDIDLEQFNKGTYYISFSSASLKCNSEFSIN